MIAACEPCSHSPRWSIHRLTYTPPTPPALPRRLGETPVFQQQPPLYIRFQFPIPPLSVVRPSIPPLLIIFTLALLRIQPLPLSCSSLSPPTLLPASSPCQLTALNTCHLTRSPSAPVLFFSYGLDFPCPLCFDLLRVDSHLDLLSLSSCLCAPANRMPGVYI